MSWQLVFGPLLLVYQMPKTGSQTVEATLEPCGLPHKILRLHFMSPALAERVAAELSARNAGTEWEQRTRAQLARASQTRRALRLRRQLRHFGVPLSKVLAVSAVREPISLQLAAVFENFAASFKDADEAALTTLRNEFLKPRDHLFVHRWFDLELQAMLGIDVYRTPFPREQGYELYENSFARVLVYRFEALGQLPVMLSKLMGRPVPALVSRNMAKTKDYADAYQRVKQQLRLPAEFVRAQCQCRPMQHFYSEAERRSLEARWSETPAARGVERGL
jgi:hypothetical protein